MSTRIVSISDFDNAVSGKIYVPATIHYDMNEWVQIVKRDLMKVYRNYDIKWVEIDDDKQGHVYVHGASEYRKDLEY